MVKLATLLWRSCSSLSAKPNWSMISMTEGCSVSPLNSRSKSGCASSSVTSTPLLASSSDRTAPPGPPPTTQQVVRLTSRTSSGAAVSWGAWVIWTAMVDLLHCAGVRSATVSLASTFLLFLGLESFQKKVDRRLYVLFVGQPILSNDREEQFASGLRKEHPYEGPGAGSDIVRAEPAKLDLARHVTLEEPRHPLYHRAAEYLRDLGAPHGFSYYQPYHPLSGGIVEGREVSPGDGGQHLLRWKVKQAGGILHRTQHGDPGPQHLPKERLLVREIPVDQGRRLQARSPRDALDRRPLEPLGRELLEGRT